MVHMRNGNTYSISQAARELGLSADWLRRAERRGSLPPARRDRQNHRHPTKDDLGRLRARRLWRPGG
ncbi:MAG: MerR family transcriptional regulator [Actinomycetota bacterium]|nr:MerR family transcriptional regulator [Actinomycetota bacterium]